MPTGELADAALVLVGGVLLMLPGFVTDLFGLLFLLPFTRPLARRLLAFLVGRRLSRMGVWRRVVRRDVTVIEGETVPDPHAGTAAAGLRSAHPIISRGEIEEGPRKRA